MGRCVSSFLLLLLMVMTQTISSVPIIHAPWGALQGIREQGEGGRTMDAYLGIPYAVPPVGERRFEKSLPHPGHGKGEVFVADRIMPACPQKTLLIGSTREMSEDCLMLDVYVPADDDTDATTVSKPYAVMVFIHGGGFTMGDAYSYKPSKIVADGKVIVVVIQYRLGVLGFLVTGDDTVTENLGLWDQNLALRWVKDNIQSFGGDPDRITIFGESAGSMSVGMHTIIPQSKGLFKRAILQSGAPQDIFRFVDYIDKKSIFRGLTDMVGCQGANSLQLLDCLKQQPLQHLMNKSVEYEMTSPIFAYFLPTVDGELIQDKPRKLAQDLDFLKDNGVGDIDVMLGFNKDEGALVLIIQIMTQASDEGLYTADFFRSVADMCFGLNGLGNNTAVKKATEFFYRRADFGSNISQSLDPLVNMYGDCLFSASVTEWARYLAAAPHSAALYMYVVDHDFVFNNQGPKPGAHHGDELLLLFDMEGRFPEDSVVTMLNKTTMSEEERGSLSAKLVKMWTAFAKTGNPSGPIMKDLGGEWPQYTMEEEHYLSFSRSPRVVPKLGPYRDRVALWLNLLPQLDALFPKPAPEEKAAEDQASPREEL